MYTQMMFHSLEMLSEPEPSVGYSVSSLLDINQFLLNSSTLSSTTYTLITLSTQNEVIASHALPSFTSRAVFMLSIFDNAAGFIIVRFCAKNEPLYPTITERQLVSEVFSDSEIMGISLYDYILFTPESVFSMADSNLNFDLFKEDEDYEL